MSVLEEKEFRINGDYLKSYNKTYNNYEITIPDNIKTIGNTAFTGCLSRIINLPLSVQVLQNYSFKDCKKLKEINITKNVSSIFEGTFRGCSSLVSINIEPSNPYYEEKDGLIYDKKHNSLLLAAPGLNGSVTVKEGISEIGDNAFYGCKKITEIILPEGIERIGCDAFKNTAITSITLPSTFSEGGENCFRNCDSLTEIKIKADNPYFECVNGILYNKEKTKVIFIPNNIQGKLILNENVTELYEDAFFNKKVSEIVMPPLVSTLMIKENEDRKLFEDCENLTKVIFTNSRLKIKRDAFSIKRKCSDERFYSFLYCLYPTQLTSNEKDKAFFEIIDLLDEGRGIDEKWNSEWLNVIKKNVHKHYTAIGVNLSIVEKLCKQKAIGIDEVQGISKVAEKNKQLDITAFLLDYQNNTFSIDEVMEKNFNDLTMDVNSKEYVQKEFNFRKRMDGTYIITSYTGTSSNVIVPSFIDDIPVTEIGQRCFSPVKSGRETYEKEKIRNIKKITIPSNIKVINSSAFYLLDELEEVVFSEGLERFDVNMQRYGRGMFWGTNVTKVSIPSTVTSLPSELFANCTRLKEVVLPSSIKEIGKECFKGCTDLTKINIPPLSEIKEGCFTSCKSLNCLSLPDSVTVLGDYCFSYCNDLTVEIGEGKHRYGLGFNLGTNFVFKCKKDGRVWRTCERYGIKHIEK